jgi:hypothetical protein
MAIGNMLRERGEQYVANQDDKGTWRILDTWNDALKILEPDEDVPDNSPAVTIMSEGAFLALMKEASRLGVLENASSLLGNEELNTQIRDLQEHIVKLQSEKEDLMVQTRRSDTFELKHEALGAVLKLAAMGEMDEILKD